MVGIAAKRLLNRHLVEQLSGRVGETTFAGRASVRSDGVAGRIEIDDVAPVVSGGRFPAKAVVGEIIPVRAAVWREGHDAVSATLVVRYHGAAYPKLADDPPGRVRHAEAVAIPEGVGPSAGGKPAV